MKLSDAKSELYKVKGCIIKNIRKVNSELCQDLRKGASYCDMLIAEVYHLSVLFLPALYSNVEHFHWCSFLFGKLLPRVQMFLSVNL